MQIEFTWIKQLCLHLPLKYLQIGDTKPNKNCANNFLIEIAACNLPQQYVYEIPNTNTNTTVQRGVCAICSTQWHAYCACC